MHIRLLAIGERQPNWVNEAFASYAARLPRNWQFRLDEIAAAKRTRTNPSERAISTEAKLLLDRIDVADQVVLLDERGKQFASKALAERLQAWLNDGRNLVFVIGGPDGVADEIRQRANAVWSLSTLTLPHGLARVLCAEQLYRSWSVLQGHPYHRE